MSTEMETPATTLGAEVTLCEEVPMVRWERWRRSNERATCPRPSGFDPKPANASQQDERKPFSK